MISNIDKIHDFIYNWCVYMCFIFYSRPSESDENYIIENSLIRILVCFEMNIDSPVDLDFVTRVALKNHDSEMTNRLILRFL